MEREQNQQQLRLLTIFHYVCAALAALFACFPIIHLVIGILALTSPEVFCKEGQGECGAAVVGWIFILFAGLFILLGMTFALCLFLAGRNLQRRKHYTFCQVMAIIECLFMPFGTVLGVFTLIVLNRPSVRALFEGQPPAPSPTLPGA